MTITDAAPVKHAGPRDTDAEDRAAALKMMRADAIEYVTSLFDWLDEGQQGDSRPSGAWMTVVHACYDATEKHFHEVLAGIIKSAEENGFSYEYFCTENSGCRCLNCRYPAEDDEDMRSPWAHFMVNFRKATRRAARDVAEAR